MPDIATLVKSLVQDGAFMDLARSPAAQFGVPSKRYVGAEILPEKLVEENAYEETGIAYRTVIANDGSRYSPPQLKGTEIVGSFLVQLGNFDIQRELTGRDYDGLLKLLRLSGQNPEMAAVAQIINFVDLTVNRAMIEKQELQRWQAIQYAQVARTGDNGYTDNVLLSNPTGTRVTIPSGTQASPTGWYDKTGNYDPFLDIFAAARRMAGKGYKVNRIICSTQLMFVLSANKAVQTRTGSIKLVGGALDTLLPMANMAQINAALSESALPPIEVYDLQYRTQTASFPFLAPQSFCLICETGRDMEIDLGDAGFMIMPNVLGYYGLGRPVGQSDPGRVIKTFTYEDKPPRMTAQGWGTGFPVIMEPEALTVLTVPSPT